MLPFTRVAFWVPIFDPHPYRKRRPWEDNEATSSPNVATTRLGTETRSKASSKSPASHVSRGRVCVCVCVHNKKDAMSLNGNRRVARGSEIFTATAGEWLAGRVTFSQLNGALGPKKDYRLIGIGNVLFAGALHTKDRGLPS